MGQHLALEQFFMQALQNQQNQGQNPLSTFANPPSAQSAIQGNLGQSINNGFAQPNTPYPKSPTYAPQGIIAGQTVAK